MSRFKMMIWSPTIILLLVVMTGCVSARPTVETLSDVGADEVIVVGGVELSPRMEEGEQRSDLIGLGDIRNTLFVFTDDHWREKRGGFSSGDEYFEAKWGESFYIKSKNKPFYILKGMILMEGPGVDEVYLPGGLKVEIQAKDKAVYIGKMHYVRNEYSDITKSEIIDDYDRANAEFKKKFGAKYNLRKALVVPIKSKK